MNKRILILGAIIVVILAAAFFFLMPKNAPLNNNGNTGDANTTADLFTQAFTGGGSVKCTFTQEGSTATAYIKQGKIRFDSMGTDGAQYGNAIINGNIVYVWQAGSNQGMMIDSSKIEGANAGVNEQFMDAENIKAEVEKNQPNCVQENVDDAVFTPPASVTFTDYSAMTQQMQQNPAAGGNMSADQYQQLLEQYGQ